MTPDTPAKGRRLVECNVDKTAVSKLEVWSDKTVTQMKEGTRKPSEGTLDKYI